MEAAGDRDQLSQGELAQAAGLGTPGALQAALQAGSAAERHLVSEHKGFLMSIVNKYAHQVPLHCVCILLPARQHFSEPKFPYSLNSHYRLRSLESFLLCEILSRMISSLPSDCLARDFKGLSARTGVEPGGAVC